MVKGWQQARLTMLAHVIRGVSYDKVDALQTPQYGYYPILRATNIVGDDLLLDSKLVYLPSKYVKAEQLLKPWDIVVCMSSGSKNLVGKAAQLSHEWPGSFGTFCAGIRFGTEIDPKFGGYFFSSPGYREFIRQKSSGININNLRHSDMEALLVPIPPLPEQHRIVAKIEELFSELDAGVANLKRVRAALKRYRASVLKAACEGKLVPQDPSDEPASQLLARILAERRAKWEEEQRAKGKDPAKAKYEEPAPPDVKGLPELPEGWAWSNFEQLLTELKNGYFSGTPNNEPPGIPILRINAVRPMRVTLDAPRFIAESEMQKARRYLLCDGDLLFTRYNGSLELVGACGLVRHLGKSALLYPDKLIRGRVQNHLISPAYLELYFATAIPRRIIENKVKSTAGQQGIAGGDLKNIPVAMPPLTMQYRIVAEAERRLSVVQELEATVEANLKRAERLRQAILKRAFEGRLVEQEAADKPTAQRLLSPM